MLCQDLLYLKKKKNRISSSESDFAWRFNGKNYGWIAVRVIFLGKLSLDVDVNLGLVRVVFWETAVCTFPSGPIHDDYSRIIFCFPIKHIFRVFTKSASSRRI